MSEKYYVNFEMALQKLSQFVKEFDQSEIQRAGVIQAFEFTYEQAWKALQKKSDDEGVTIASPKKAFAWALQSGLIKPNDEQIWIEILSDRNLTLHTYRQAMAIQVSNNVVNIYLKYFESLLTEMKKDS